MILDDEGGVPTRPEDWAAALAFARRAASEVAGLPEPMPAPCGDGSVHLSWYRDGTRLTVERRGDLMFVGLATRSGFVDEPCTEDGAIALLRKHFSRGSEDG